MYWPIGTPRIYATSSSRSSAFKLLVSHDGLPCPSDSVPTASPNTAASQSRASGLDDDFQQPPPTPATPATPAVVEHEDYTTNRPQLGREASSSDGVPVKDPILALRASRSGDMFAVITKTSITVWQSKV